MPNPKNRVIIDTNLWISFLLKRNLSIFRLAVEGHFSLISCSELTDEFLSVANRPKFRNYFPLYQAEEFLFQLTPAITFIEITSVVSICRDSKDNFLLSLALDSKATHLISGDQDLLVLKKFGDTQILTLTEYLTTEKYL